MQIAKDLCFGRVEERLATGHFQTSAEPTFVTLPGTHVPMLHFAFTKKFRALNRVKDLGGGGVLHVDQISVHAVGICTTFYVSTFRQDSIDILELFSIAPYGLERVV